MSSAGVLVVSNEQDVGADFLVQELTARRLNVVRFNTERSPAWKLNLRPGRSWDCRGPTRGISSADCLGVWWRRPEPPALPSDASPASEAVADQWRAFLGALATVQGPVWVSEPANIRRAESKALQLQLADGLGLCPPETLWTTDIDQARAFLDRHDAVVKSVASAWWEADGKGHFVFASAVSAGDLPEGNRLAAAPVCFQQRIQPKRDVRATVVSERVLAAERVASSDGAEPLDWRLAAPADWQPCDVPSEVADGCCELVRALGLRFAGVDFVVDDRGQYWFLELNPNGEWGWLQRAGLPIAQALADVLAGGA